MAAARPAGSDSVKHLFLQWYGCNSNAIEVIPKKIFSRGSDQRCSEAGLVQQTDQIVASHDLSLFVRGHFFSHENGCEHRALEVRTRI